jgi:hypothetical protein
MLVAMRGKLVAMRGKEEFLRTFLLFFEADIERIGVAHDLLLKGAFKAPKAVGKGAPKPIKPTKLDVIETFWNRASARTADLYPRRVAAE